MKRFASVLVLLPLLAFGQAWLSAPASYTCRVPCDLPSGDFLWHTVKYPATNVTVCGLIATTTSPYPGSLYGDPQQYFFSDGEAITRGPDWAAGRWGWETGAVFAGTVSVTTNTTYKCGLIPVGYAVVGESSNAATITVGGSSITVTGKFDRSIGPTANGTAITMNTTGWANIGITQMCSNEWFGAIDVVADETRHFPDATSINTNTAFLSYTWTCNASTNFVVRRWSKYGATMWYTNYFHLSRSGCIAQGAQMRIPPMNMFSGDSQRWRCFGWRAIYGPRPTEAKFQQLEIDARAEYTARGWGQ